MAEEPNNPYMGENEPNQPGPNNNRTFILIAGIIGALVVLVLIILAVYALVILPRNKASYQAQVNERIQANTATVAALTAAAKTLNAATSTLPPATSTTVPSFTATSKPSSTPVVAVPTSTNTPVPPKAEVDPRTATVSALLTQAAQAKLTTTVTTLPKTGFADESGLPLLVGLAILLVVVIFIVRRMRSSPTA